MRIWALALAFLCSASVSQARLAPSVDQVRDVLHGMTGCYLVDYSYAETESLKEGYTRDTRVYDVNRTRSVKEWIYADDVSPTRVRLQHVLFAVSLDGQVDEMSLLKHTGEDWEYQAPFLYQFTRPLTWNILDLSTRQGEWVRRITNLDDGLRAQCSAAWTFTGGYPEWSCADYAPIPGRETRDMGRKDYDALARSTRVVYYGQSWLERQDNVKTIDRGSGREPLARELGKNWYVRVPDSDCQAARDFVTPRHDFWVLTREVWDQVLIGDRPFVEKPGGSGQRYGRIMRLEDEALSKNLQDPAVRADFTARLLQLIQDFRN